MVKGQLVIMKDASCGSPRISKNWVRNNNYPQLKKGTIGVYLYSYESYEVVYFPCLKASYGVYDYEIKKLESSS